MSVISICLFAFINTLQWNVRGKNWKDACTLSTPSFPFYRWGTWEQNQGRLAGFSWLTVISAWTQRTGIRRTERPEPDFWAVSGTLMGLGYEVSCLATADRTIPLACPPGSEDSHPEGGGGTPGGTPSLKGETFQIWSQLGPRESWGSPSHTAWSRGSFLCASHSRHHSHSCQLERLHAGHHAKRVKPGWSGPSQKHLQDYPMS